MDVLAKVFRGPRAGELGVILEPELGRASLDADGAPAHTVIKVGADCQQQEKIKLMNAAIRVHFAGSKHNVTNE